MRKVSMARRAYVKPVLVKAAKLASITAGPVPPVSGPIMA